MSRTVFHLLTETDSFSDIHGAALQRWVANVLRFDEARSVIVCARADTTWNLPRAEPRKLLALRAYSHLKGRYRLPWRLRKPLLRRVLQPGLAGLKPRDVVWIHNRPDYAGAIQNDVRAAGAKLVLHLHNSLLISFPEEITGSFIADRIVFCSQFLEAEARRRWPALTGTSVIHNGADERRFFPGSSAFQKAATRPVVLFAGRLVPEKGAHVFVEAMRVLEQRGVAALGRIVGASGFGSKHSATSYVRRLRQAAPANVVFGGYRPGSTLAQEFRDAHIFCCPSVWEEPFGLVIVEAMASGLPTVTTRSGGIPEIFAEGGALLVARDSAPELAAALEQLLRDQAKRNQLAADGLANFRRNFTWQAVHARYMALLATL